MKVREVLKLFGEDGWCHVKTGRRHRRYKHAEKPGRVTVAGEPSHHCCLWIPSR